MLPGDPLSSASAPAGRETQSEPFDTPLAEGLPESSDGELGTPRGLDQLLLVLALGLIVVTLSLSPGGLAERLNYLGRAVCGQLAEHSFFFGGRQLPLCARCTGTYLGALTTYVMLSLMGRGRASRLPPVNILLILLLFIAFWALDGLNSYLPLFTQSYLLYEPSNILRLASGLLQGLAIMVIVRPIFAFTLWAETSDERVVRHWGELVLLLAVVALVGLAAQSELPWLYYPLALLSGTGVLLVLSLVNTLILCVLLRREGRAASWRQAVPLTLLGLALALVEAQLVNLAREAIFRLLGIAA